MITKRKCPVCSKIFSVDIYPCLEKLGHGRFCSRKCANEFMSSGRIGKPKISSRLDWPNDLVKLSNGSMVKWHMKFYRNNQCRVWIVCGTCKRNRSIFAHETKRQQFTGLCQGCSRRVSAPKGNKHPRWKGGKFISGAGYVVINIRSLSGRDYEISKQMARLIHGKPAIIGEHRLVMAIHLNRPLLPSEVVHHKNGIKTDNRLDNLEIVTHASHRKLDTKYYDLWQKALSEIAILKEQVSKFLQSKESTP